MNLHTMAVNFHTPQANLILGGRSCLSAAAVMNHVCEGRKMHFFLSLFICVDSWLHFPAKCSGHNVQSLVHLDITLWLYLLGETGVQNL